MKLMIASDIHGSAYYCSKLMEAFYREKPDKLLLLGDLLYHGPRNALPKEYDPGKVIEMLNNIKEEILCVRGNCDTEVDQMVLEFPIMAEYAIFYLENRMIFATHGHKFNPVDRPMLKKGDILLNGHTHIPKCDRMEEFIYMNPGSVSIPKENSAHSYMIVEKEFVWKDLEGNCYRTESCPEDN
ncbi:phosphodiesterase [Anaerocolumna sp. AGMB13025]|uniref:phosphodiesterase n=1 Tax=Anaerocolumna sp. AGMB13025 TaxID=3039116 RepID=UPI00241E61DC|nr:phosphodiesterase [Anaerocolumna sp. AGMB13025]WFR55478.1 phosphodiesterase [Anaerocolumna sp. AGMB13025]